MACPFQSIFGFMEYPSGHASDQPAENTDTRADTDLRLRNTS